MKIMFKLTLTSLLLTIMCFNINAQQWSTPTIEGYGKIMVFENVEIKPDPGAEHKVFFNITTDKLREGVNVSLWKMARLINLLDHSGVPQKNIHLAAVISGPATPIALSEKIYFEKTGKSNPHLDLMKKLTEYGVKIHLCGQAAGREQLDPNTDLNPYTQLTLSALTDIPAFQRQGYVIMF